MTTTRYAIQMQRIDDVLAPKRPAWCMASTDAVYLSMLECGRRRDHDGPHYDFRHDKAWTDTLGNDSQLVDLEGWDA